MIEETPAILQKTDDICFGFSLPQAQVRGQIASLGPATADEIISRHKLPPAISNLLGQALALVTLSGASLKFNGRMIVELRKEYDKFDAPLDFLVVEYNTNKSLRGMAKINSQFLDKLLAINPNPSLPELFGEGFLLVTIDQGAQMEKYQGQIAIDCDDLSTLACNYFSRSEQIETKILLACENEKITASHSEWRAAGIMIQKIAGDDNRGETEDAWLEAGYKFNTLSAEELLDRDLSAGDILLRLFHENGVESFSPNLLIAKCNCSHTRLVALMRGFAKEDIEHMIEEDGQIHARCEFCNTTYHINPSDFGN